MFSPFVLEARLKPYVPAHRFHVIEMTETAPDYIEYTRLQFDHLPAFLQGRGCALQDRNLFKDWLLRGGSVSVLPATPVTILLADWFAIARQRSALQYQPVSLTRAISRGYYDHNGQYYDEQSYDLDYPDFSEPDTIARAQAYEQYSQQMRNIKQQLKNMIEVSA
jgi:hypothetical protein